MEWERAKNYILVFFILLNLGLGFLWFMEYNRYVMTTEQERIIHSILSQNNISMYTRPMRRSPPMRPLNVYGFYYDTNHLINMFFENPEAVEEIPQNDFLQFISDNNSRLEISNGFISYENESPYGFQSTALYFTNGLFTRHTAVGLADNFINTNFPNFVQETIFYVDDGVRITYRQSYRGRIVHSNFVEFLITSKGIRQINMQFGQVSGHGGTSQMIFSPDEALLTFVQRYRHISLESPRVITHMDIAYFQEYISEQPGVPLSAIPYYRIFVQGDDRPFLINAFTNVIID